MSAADGFVSGTVKVVDHGPNGVRYNIVIVGDGYRAADAAKYHADVQGFVDALRGTAPFADLWCGINIHRVDVVSTDGGADDPASCGDLSAGSGAAPRTYFDSTFCSGGGIRRLLTCDGTSAQTVARAQVPEAHMTLVIVNSPLYGGSGGSVATFSTHASAAEIALHEMGHTAFGLADEYESYAGCSSGETDRNHYVGGEPVEPNVTLNANRNTIKWQGALTSPADALPTTVNGNCAQCDTQADPKPAGYVGAYTGARYYHCGCYRPAYDCRMRTLGQPFCAVCQKIIRDTLRPYLPAAYQGLWWAAPAGAESGWGINFAHQGDTIFATWFTYDAGGRAWWLSMTAVKSAWNVYTGTLLETRGPPLNAMPFNPALVTKNAVGTGTLTFTDANNASFAFTVNGVNRTKAITRQAFGPLPTCTFGVQQALSLATNYQDLWWAAPPGAESGWGINFTHQGNTIFATWFTYHFDGSPLWLSVTASNTAPGVYAGTLYLTSGPAFDAVPFLPANVVLTPVGTATLTFANGNSATFAYTITLGTPPVAVTQTKPITRQIFQAPGTVCQ